MDRSTLARRIGPFAVFAAVLGGIVVVNGRGTTSVREPRALPINAASGRNAEDAARGSSAPMGAPAYWTQTRIPDGLMNGLPSEGPAYEVRGDTDRIAALARALGVDGEVRRVERGWVVGTGDKVLSVAEYPGRPWYLGSDKTAEGRGGSTGSGVAVNVVEPATPMPAPTAKPGSEPGSEPVTPPSPPDPPSTDPSPGDTPVGKPYPCPTTEPGTTDACAVPVPMPQPTMPPQPSDADARAAMEKILAALAIEDPAVTLAPGYMGKEVTAAPVVGGLPTVGFETRATVDAAGGIVYASGYLGTATLDARYPLLDPRAAVERGGIGYARDLPAIATAPPPGAEFTVAPSPYTSPTPTFREPTAIRLGLMLMPSYEQDGPAFLVPAWLLTFEGSSWEEPYLALPDKFLQTPPPPTGDPGEPVCDPAPCPTKEGPPPPDSRDGGGTTGSTGSTGSAGDPGSVDGATGAPE